MELCPSVHKVVASLTTRKSGGRERKRNKGSEKKPGLWCIHCIILQVQGEKRREKEEEKRRTDRIHELLWVK